MAPVAGQIYWEISVEGPSIEPPIGKEYKETDHLCYIQAPWGEWVEVKAGLGGKLVDIRTKQGDKVHKGDTIAYIERPKEA